MSRRRGLVSLLAAVLLLGGGTAAQASGPGESDVFQSRSFVSDDLSSLPQWREALERGRKESAAIAACGADCASLKELVWRAQLAGVRPADPLRKLFVLNGFVNGLGPHTDAAPPPLGRPWPSVRDTLKGAGGAMGAAILKYLSLREVGLPAQDMRIAIVRDALRGNDVVLLLVRVDGQDIVLDSTHDSLREARRVRTLIPYYSFNEDSVWIHIPTRQEAEP